MKLSLQELQDLETEMLKVVAEICERHNIDYYLAYGTALGAVRHQGPIPWDNDADIALPNYQLDCFIEVMNRELPDKFYLRFKDSEYGQTGFVPRIGLRGYSTKILHIDVFRIVGAPSDKEEQELFFKKARSLGAKMQYKNLKEGYFSFDKISLKAKLAIYIQAFKMLFTSKKTLNKRFDALCELYPFNGAEMTVNITGGYGMKEFIPKSFYGNGVNKKYEGFNVKLPEQYHKYLEHFYGNYMNLPSKEEQEKVNRNYHIYKLK